MNKMTSEVIPVRFNKKFLWKMFRWFLRFWICFEVGVWLFIGFWIRNIAPNVEIKLTAWWIPMAFGMIIVKHIPLVYMAFVYDDS